MHLSRRSFLEAGVASAALPYVAQARVAHEPATVVVDAGRYEALEFAAAFRDAGIGVNEIRDDVTSVWQHVLAEQWRKRPAGVAGMTHRSALFCLEQLAWAHGLRVVMHVVHASGSGRHEVLRDVDGLRSAELRAAGARWPSVIATAILQRRQQALRPGPSAVAAPASFDADAAALHTWVIAPEASLGGIA